MRRSRLITGLSIALTYSAAFSVSFSAYGCGGDHEPGSVTNGSGGRVATGSGGATTGSGGAIAGRSGTGGASMMGMAGMPAAGSGGKSPGTGGMAAAGTGGMAAAGTGGMAAGTGGVTTPINGMNPTMLPTAPEPCPMLTEGASTVMILGTSVNIWVGPKSEQKGPIYIWWHGTGGNGARGNMALGGNAYTEIMAQGGIVAAPNETTKMGTDTCNAVWYTGDFGIADEIVACAIEQLNIDTSRIYTGGASAGGLQAGAMAYGRSGYLAGAVPNSGGVSPRPGLTTWQDMAHPPAVLNMYGAMGDVVSGLDFASSSATLATGVAAAGGFAVNCGHGAGHVGASAELTAASWDFLKAHPYGTKPSPYAGGLPASYPTYCTIVK